MPKTKAVERLELYQATLASTTEQRSVFTDSDGLHIQILGMSGEYETICTITNACPVSERDILLNCFEREADLIRMIYATRQYLPKILAKKDDEIAALRGDIEAMGGRPAKNYAAECAIKCADSAFQRFLAQRHNLKLPATKDTASTRVRSVLAISSRSDINQDPAAAARWRRMVKDYENWRNRA